MRSPLLPLAALLVAGALAAVVTRAPAPDPLAGDSLRALLERPLDAPPGVPAFSSEPLWRVLLAPPFAEVTPAGVTLRLGHVLADPTAARLSAECAAELLELEAQGPEGPLGISLGQAILTLALEADPPRTLRLHGCRHTAEASAGPVLEDTYFARLALAAGLRRLAEAESGAALNLLGEKVPVAGGVNLDVQLAEGRQLLVATFEGRKETRRWASRELHPVPHNDARARSALGAALRDLAAADASFASFTLEGLETPLAGGVDLQIEHIGSRVSLSARSGQTLVSAHRELEPSATGER